MGDLVHTFFESYKTLASNVGEQFVSLDEGLSIVSQHAHLLGYDALVLFLDELILWLATHVGEPAFLHREMQKLAKLVEAQHAERPVPVISFIARQRDLRELIGDKVDGVQKISFLDSFNWSQGRFETITLEDLETLPRNEPRASGLRNDARLIKTPSRRGWCVEPSLETAKPTRPRPETAP